MRAIPNVTLFNPVFGAAAGQARDFAAGDCTSTIVQNVTESCFEIAATGNAATAIGTRSACTRSRMRGSSAFLE